jgi:hypothetical protein
MLFDLREIARKQKGRTATFNALVERVRERYGGKDTFLTRLVRSGL